MSAPFVTTIRARKSTIDIAPPETQAITIRVEMPEVWDVVRITAAATQPVLAVKMAALEALFPQADMHQDFVLKLRGWQILDEGASLEDAGIVDRSILLLTHRRKRPVH